MDTLTSTHTSQAASDTIPGAAHSSPTVSWPVLLVIGFNLIMLFAWVISRYARRGVDETENKES